MMSGPKTLAILGSTGSIGRQAVQVAARFPERIKVVALAAHSSAETLVEQATALGVPRVALVDPAGAATAREALPTAEVLSGADAAARAAEGADIVLNALVGSAGLEATLVALRSGSRLALANKESLVVGGELVMRHATGGNLIPVDSEHSAIFQCLVGESAAEVERIWLTASGGPFRGSSLAALEAATVEQALAHPTWQMGPKITVDSATLMNKGLEVIEAHRLFAMPYERIQVVVHPQSVVHSMVEFADGSVKAHVGVTDMRIPIQYALSFPERWEAPLQPLDFTALSDLTFEPADQQVFRCLGLAYEAGAAGGTMPAVLNAANEVAVAAFLDGGISLASIPQVIEAVMNEHATEPLESVEQVLAADKWARQSASTHLFRA